MLKNKWVVFVFRVVSLLSFSVVLNAHVFASEVPFSVRADLFDSQDREHLGLDVLASAETHRVYSSSDGDVKYNHGATTIGFKGKLYVQWQASLRDEDAPETQVLFASSEDGASWGTPETLVEAREDALVTNGGWWTDGETLVAYINVWPHDLEPKAGFTEVITSRDGIAWTSPRRLRFGTDLLVDGVIEQDVRALPNGRLISALHRQPGLIAVPIYTDSPLGIDGWQLGEMPVHKHQRGMSRELEPSWFRQQDGDLVMTFRDQDGSFRILASVSQDQGEHWSASVETDYPDSRAKQSAGNLPDGTAFIVNNPSGNKTRIPLTISRSCDGEIFDKAWILRSQSDLQPMQFDGRYKRVGYSYPKSRVWGDSIYVSYATNKEDIEVTRIPIDAIECTSKAVSK